ncbi:regulatory protein RecX [Planctomonas deserti]|uniref:regulatory protein RecX n=1 Tax=Planctomonas deserti TaxID=2144185 RepID=UPI000D3C5E57|nr:regulatory protein RecX [Planctomonas deserti]
MVRFPPASDREDGGLAPVTYLRGASAPGGAAAPDGAAAQTGWAPSDQDVPDHKVPDQDRSEKDRRRAEGLARITAHVAVGDPEAGETEPEADHEAEPEPEAPLQDIETVSMRALTRRGMSRWELGDLLARREYDIEAIEAELDRLQRVDLLDDAALAETVVRTKHERKGLGRNALARELAQRHIDPAVIDEAVSAIDDEDEQAMATEMAVKRARQFSSLDAATAERRLTGYLMRRGYSSSIVREATRVALAGHGRGSGVRFR